MAEQTQTNTNSPAINELLKNMEATKKVKDQVANPLADESVNLENQQKVNDPNPTDIANLNISQDNKQVQSRGPTIPQPHVPAPSAIMSKSPTKRTFYSFNDGSPYYFADGGVAIFQGGEYVFDPDNIPDEYVAPEGKDRKDSWLKRYNELMYVCSIPNPVFSLTRVALHRSDAVVLREVGHSGGGVAPAQMAASGVGMLGSTQMTSLFRQS